MQLDAFRRVRFQIQPFLRHTPVVASEIPQLSLKLENLQRTHSFKVRGAFAAVVDLVERKDEREILAVSAGNHGQAVALASSHFGRSCTVVVPESAPKAKIEAIRAHGVGLRVEGRNYDEAEMRALELSRDRERYAFVSAYNHPQVILGQGSLAFEILEQCPTAGTILVPIGGGGLIAGVAAVVKQCRPRVKVIGVQAEVSAAVYHSLKMGKMVTVPDAPSIADGIQGNIDLETITFEPIRKYVDDVVLVSENAIRAAMNQLLLKEKLVVEGSGAVGYAAVMEGKVSGDGIVALISGGNLDLPTLF